MATPRRQDPLKVSAKALDELAALVARRAPLAEFARAALAAIKRVEYLIAYDITSAAVQVWGEQPLAPADPQYRDYVLLRQKRAEALAKAGAIDRARLVLNELRALDADDPETLGFLARLDKDVWDANRLEPEASRLLHVALDSYLRAYHRTGAYWHGINAATLAVCADRDGTAVELVNRVRADCESRLGSPELSSGERYWLLATLGEAALVLGDETDAGQWYEQAAAIAIDERDYSSLCSTRRNARMLLRHRGRDVSIASQWMPVPPVLVFSGHLLDRPGRATPRFPDAVAGDVARLIAQKLQRREVSFLFTSAGCGADLLAAEAVLESGGDVHVVLPFGREAFAETSVAFAGEAWSRRYDALLDDPSGRVKVTILSTHPSRDPVNDFEFANRVMFGLARAKSLEMGTDLTALAVWDGRAGDGPGGTASNIARWRSSRVPVEVIDLSKILRARGLTGAASAEDAPATGATFLGKQDHIAAMLFADVKGFSELLDDAMESFVAQYLGLVAEVLGDPQYPPLVANTWGDGLFVVFDDVRHAGIIALRLCERIDAARRGGRLSLDLRLRVALHAGPVLRCHNAVTGRPDVIGVHVNRAARLEPSTPTGHVYATEPFVALAYATHVEEFRCDYVGPTRLAKDFGTEPAYHVRWVGAAR